MPGALNFAAAALPEGAGRGALVPVEMLSAFLGIVVLQAGSYIFLGMALVLMLFVVADRPCGLHDLFMAGDHTVNDFVAIGFAHALAYGPQILIMGLIVQHMSQVLDHVLSFAALHLIIQWFLVGFPTSAAWWLLATLDVITLSVVGEIACARRDAFRLAMVSQAMEQSTPAARSAPSLPGRGARDTAALVTTQSVKSSPGTLPARRGGCETPSPMFPSPAGAADIDPKKQ
jgi:hypothetical protein